MKICRTDGLLAKVLSNDLRLQTSRYWIFFCSVYLLKPATFDQLQSIHKESNQSLNEAIHHVCYSIASRYQQYLDQNGHQFEHLR